MSLTTFLFILGMLLVLNLVATILAIHYYQQSIVFEEGYTRKWPRTMKGGYVAYAKGDWTEGLYATYRRALRERELRAMRLADVQPPHRAETFGKWKEDES